MYHYKIKNLQQITNEQMDSDRMTAFLFANQAAKSRTWSMNLVDQFQLFLVTYEGVMFCEMYPYQSQRNQ